MDQHALTLPAGPAAVPATPTELRGEPATSPRDGTSAAPARPRPEAPGWRPVPDPGVLAPESTATAHALRERIYRRMLAGADVLAVELAVLALVATSGRTPTVLALAIAPAMVVLAKVMGLYDRDELLVRRSTLDEVPRLFHLATLASFSMWLGQGVVFDGEIGPRTIAGVWGVLLVAMIVLRWTARELAGRLAPADRCLFIGESELLARHREQIEHAGRVEVLGSLPLHEIMRDLPRLRRIVAEHDAHRLIISPHGAGGHEAALNLIREAKATGLRVSLMPGILEVVGSSVLFDNLGGVTLLGVKRFGLSRSSKLLKRSFDLVGASVALVLASPVMLAIAVAIRATSKGPALFPQTRIGREGREFRIFKFRTMIDGADAMRDQLRDRNEATDGLFKIADDPRITRVGKLLRRTSLDELPQLFNVLRGEMSLVGPRPLIADEDRRVTGHGRRRLTLTPGMTGPWQVAGSARVPLAEMIQMDYLYVAGWSLWGDIKICIRTCRYMLAARGQ